MKRIAALCTLVTGGMLLLASCMSLPNPYIFEAKEDNLNIAFNFAAYSVQVKTDGKLTVAPEGSTFYLMGVTLSALNGKEVSVDLDAISLLTKNGKLIPFNSVSLSNDSSNKSLANTEPDLAKKRKIITSVNKIGNQYIFVYTVADNDKAQAIAWYGKSVIQFNK